ncbi:MAG: isochorismatase family protein [Hoeflea sp.]|nr:isochorismatase family protein [Hoeflea sp.]
MNVIPFRAPDPRAPAPLIAFLDMQVEHVAQGRAYSLGDTEKALANCRRLLAFARANELPILHFRQLRKPAFFSPKASFSEWIEGFRPHHSEMVFDRALPSCFHNKAFRDFIGAISKPTLIVAGFAGELACLSTLVEAYHRGHHAIFVGDASASRRLGGLDQQGSHGAVTDVIDLYAEVASTSAVLTRLQNAIVRNDTSRDHAVEWSS